MPRLVFISVTLPTPMATIRKPVSVGFVVRMTAWTVGKKNSLKAAINVFFTSHKFKMVRPDAIAMSAAALAHMIPFKSLRWLSNKKVMGKNIFPLQGKPAIAIPNLDTYPQHFAISSTRINLRPKTFFGSKKTTVISVRHWAPPVSILSPIGVN